MLYYNSAASAHYPASSLRHMGILDQRYIMGIFFPHILFPWSQVLTKLRRFLFFMSLVFVFAGLLAYSYVFYSPCNVHYVKPAGETDFYGYIFLVYIVLGGWGVGNLLCQNTISRTHASSTKGLPVGKGGKCEAMTTSLCRGCSQTFVSVSAFDAHRLGRFSCRQRRCVTERRTRPSST